MVLILIDHRSFIEANRTKTTQSEININIYKMAIPVFLELWGLPKVKKLIWGNYL